MFLERVAVVFGYWRGVKYSVNVLVGALETLVGGLVDVFLVSRGEMRKFLRRVKDKYRKVIYAQTLLTTELPGLLDWVIDVTSEARRLGILTVAGGPHASGDPYGSILSLGFDYAFVGEAEEAISNLVKTVLNGGDPSSVEGVARREGCKVKLNGRGFLRDLNAYPPYAPRHRLFNPIEISRGCPFACKYCQVSYVFSSIPRHRDPEEIMRWGKKSRRS
ncbi:MAG: cobalamin-dependent protein [Desulfurococcales archaeon]|nr:cobalamin-dependent protein [Desulfurococcales archaeon]